ncbi:Aste57867_21643 [Aphanomyces stellatus]|uniref:Aste57867_21643 protein n=1 Tax=Aphanomyces stellatus TaxID=120398 RepID=A0A485LMV9_9STRA|nr:hypothetical protein As57867_021574 [Aphanomyces stellatus]VFT98312.1 Aste57867_21643 [Aphanomyces stellatus]
MATSPPKRYGSMEDPASEPPIVAAAAPIWKGLAVVTVTSFLILALDCIPFNNAAVASKAERRYDVVVIGSGPAGLVAAEFLSRDPKVDVLVLEAGGPSLQNTGGTLVPTYAREKGWTYFDIPGEYANVAFMMPPNVSDLWRMEWLESPKNHLAKLIGGSSSINAALYFRSPDAYVDEIHWPYSARAVADGFEAIEQMFGWTDLPSTDGQYYAQGVYDVLSSALKLANYTQHDINRDRNLKHQVFGHPPFTIKHGLRDSPAKTFYGAIATRPNVAFETWATVLQIQHTNGTATDVVYNRTNQPTLMTARLKPHGAVIVAAGSLNTPKLLVQSGIGPTTQLPLVQSLDLPLPLSVETWIDNDHVGHHLFDTHQVALTFRTRTHLMDPYSFGFDYIHPSADAVDQYVHRGQAGPLASSNPVLIGYETLAHPTTGAPYHFQLSVFPHALPHINMTTSPYDWTICFNLNNPRSRGAVGFRPTNSSTPSYGLLDTPDDAMGLYWRDTDDLAMMHRFMNVTMTRLAQVDTVAIFPPETTSNTTWNAAPREWIRRHTLITDHFGGTCATAADNSTTRRCADAHFRVQGTSNIFVGDGSLVASGTVNPYGFVMYTGYQTGVNVQQFLAAPNVRDVV